MATFYRDTNYQVWIIDRNYNTNELEIQVVGTAVALTDARTIFRNWAGNCGALEVAIVGNPESHEVIARHSKRRTDGRCLFLAEEALGVPTAALKILRARQEEEAR